MVGNTESFFGISLKATAAGPPFLEKQSVLFCVKKHVMTSPLPKVSPKTFPVPPVKVFLL